MRGFFVSSLIALTACTAGTPFGSSEHAVEICADVDTYCETQDDAFPSAIDYQGGALPPFLAGTVLIGYRDPLKYIYYAANPNKRQVTHVYLVPLGRLGEFVDESLRAGVPNVPRDPPPVPPRWDTLLRVADLHQQLENKQLEGYESCPL
jgi:hypothetical protein